MDLLIATTNGHKIREIRSFLKIFKRIDLYSLLDFPQYVPPEETGITFEENAVIKATHAAKELKKWSLADDSGLVVPALSGAPGVYSARFAGPKASDKENREKLLREMVHLEGLSRSSYFECSIVLAAPNEIKKIVNGVCEGSILTKERGRNGFGYDSLFLKHDYHQTFAELNEDVKNLISHRAKALQKLKLTLEALDIEK